MRSRISDVFLARKYMKIPTMTSYDFITLLSVSSFTMGVPTLLTRLPGGDKEIFDFSKLKIGDEVSAFLKRIVDSTPFLTNIRAKRVHIVKFPEKPPPCAPNISSPHCCSNGSVQVV
jgi:hypothetical protein